MGIFSRIRVHQAEKAFAAGDPKEAERLLGEVASFGERIANNEGTPIWDKFTGVWMAREAVLEMEKLYTKAGSRAQIKETNLRLKNLTRHKLNWRRVFRPSQSRTDLPGCRDVRPRFWVRRLPRHVSRFQPF